MTLDLLPCILYRDQDVIVLDKPAGLAVHAGPNTPDHLELYLDQLRFGWSASPKLAHRLDRDTSGCLALGRHDKAIRRLGKMFMQGRVKKIYWTLVTGRPPGPAGSVDLALSKVTGKGGWRIVADPDGQRAVTDWKLMGAADGFAWIECRPRTGRTHQIRAHMKALGCPVRGDRYYGPDPETPLPLCLHAREIAIPPLGPAKPAIHAVAPVPPHMAEALAACGWTGE